MRQSGYILSVGEESCTDKENTPYICSDVLCTYCVVNGWIYPTIYYKLVEQIVETGCRYLTLVQNENFETNHSEF